jgi:SAM-dependent methyltransferase
MRQVIGRKKASIWPMCVSLGLLLTGACTAVQQRFLDPKVQREAYRYNQVFSSGTGFSTKPNALLVEATKDLRAGKALDLGMGQGRNAIYLAEQGWDVTGVDVAEVGLDQARARARELGLKLTLVLQDANEFDYGREQWDLVAVIYFDPRPYAKKIYSALKPGGVVVVEGFHRDATKKIRIGAGVVFDSGELRELFKGFEVLRYEEVEDVADWGLEKVRLVRLVGRKK